MRDLFARENEDKIVMKKILILLEKMRELQERVEQLESRQELEAAPAKPTAIEPAPLTGPSIQEEPEEEAAQAPPEEADLGYIMIPRPALKTSTTYKQSVRTLEEEALSAVTKNRREIIKQKILGVASKGQMTAKRIKEVIVDRHHYCSKATFYRYLQELKQQERIDTVELNGKSYLSPTPHHLRHEQH